MKEKIEEDRINELTESIVLKYLKKKNQPPESVVCIDIEGIASEYFKQNLIYENFAEDDPGKDAFSANGIKPIKVKRNGKIEKVVFPKNSIILDRYYLNQNNIIMRRFNIAHELGHRIYEKISPGHEAGNYHTIFDSERKYTFDELKEQMTIPESQATKVGCGLLMPMFLVKNTLKRITGKEKIAVYGYNQFLPKDSNNLKRMVDDLGVTFNMLIIRLRRLKLIEYHSIEEYLEILGLEGGEL